MKQTLLAGSCLLAVSATALFSQTAPVQQFDRSRTDREQRELQKRDADEVVPEIFPGEDEDVGPQRVVKVHPRKRLFEAVADSQYFYTSNALLNDQDEEDSTILVNSVQLALAPAAYPILGKEFSPRLGLRAQWYNYGLDWFSDDDIDVFDFHAQTAFVDGSLAISDRWRVGAGFEATRLLDQESYDEIYKEYVPYWGVQWVYPLSSAKLVSASYRGYFHFTDVSGARSDVNNRADHVFTVNYTQQLLPRLVVQPYYRFQYTGYTVTSRRNDYQNTLGVTLGYYFNPNVSVRTFASYEWKNSDENALVSDYEKFDGGVGATLVVQF